MKKKLLLILMGVAMIALVACGKQSKNNVVYIDDEVNVTQGAADVNKNESNITQTPNQNDEVNVQISNQNGQEEVKPENQTPTQKDPVESVPEITTAPVVPEKSDDIGNNELGNVTIPGEFIEEEITEEDLKIEKEFSLKYTEKDTNTVVKFYDGAFSLNNVEEVKSFIEDDIKELGWDDNKPVVMEYTFSDLGYPDIKGKLITGCIRISENDSYVLHIYLFDINNKTYAFSLENKLSVYDVAANLNYIIPSFSLDNKDLLPDLKEEQAVTEDESISNDIETTNNEIIEDNVEKITNENVENN